ncbi:MAG TPA: hypothetical protein VL336_07255 [Sphingomicrobium sp.]|nr:hypothetical protein [Sphingomicrobium sp.]
MARPLSTGKQAVNLASGEVRVSKIRRDPPPKLKEIIIRDRDEHNRRMAAIGIALFTLALMIIMFGLAAYTGHSPREYILQL